MKTNRKRVVITGLGILSSLAENIQDFREALLLIICARRLNARRSEPQASKPLAVKSHIHN